MFEGVVVFQIEMENGKRMKYCDALDQDLMDQVCMQNPWSYGKTWDDVAKAAKAAQPAFNTLTTKSLMDRANLLMKRRQKEESAELRG